MINLSAMVMVMVICKVNLNLFYNDLLQYEQRSFYYVFFSLITAMSINALIFEVENQKYITHICMTSVFSIKLYIITIIKFPLKHAVLFSTKTVHS